MSGGGVKRAHGGFAFRQLEPGGWKGQVGVRIDEARHDHPAGGVDFDRVARFSQVFHAPAGSDLGQNAVANQNRAIGMTRSL